MTGSIIERQNYGIPINTSYMEIEGRNISIKETENKQLKVNMVENFNIYAKAPEIGNITWESSNTDVVTVNNNGIITGKKKELQQLLLKKINMVM